jgi:hypothetical protein
MDLITSVKSVHLCHMVWLKASHRFHPHLREEAAQAFGYQGDSCLGGLIILPMTVSSGSCLYLSLLMIEFSTDNLKSLDKCNLIISF